MSEDIITTAANLLFGSVPREPLRRPAGDALNLKIDGLRAAGHHVAPSNDGGIPGLWRIDDGPELTSNQLLGYPLA